MYGACLDDSFACRGLALQGDTMCSSKNFCQVNFFQYSLKEHQVPIWVHSVNQNPSPATIQRLLSATTPSIRQCRPTLHTELVVMEKATSIFAAEAPFEPTCLYVRTFPSLRILTLKVSFTV